MRQMAPARQPIVIAASEINIITLRSFLSRKDLFVLISSSLEYTKEIAARKIKPPSINAEGRTISVRDTMKAPFA